MTAPKRLRAVSADEGVPRRKSVAEAAQSGDRRELLVAMRDQIAKKISDDCHARDMAPLTRRLQEIVKELDHLDVMGSGAGSVVSDSGDESFDPASV